MYINALLISYFKLSASPRSGIFSSQTIYQRYNGGYPTVSKMNDKYLRETIPPVEGFIIAISGDLQINKSHSRKINFSNKDNFKKEIS